MSEQTAAELQSESEVDTTGDSMNSGQIATQQSFPGGTICVTRKFNFKQRTLKAEDGKEIEKLPKQPAVSAPIPVPTTESVISILNEPDEFTTVDEESGKTGTKSNVKKKMVMESIYSIIFAQAKQQLDVAIDSFGADKTKQVNASFLDYDQLSLEYIASIPPARRGAVAISEEEWRDLFVDYINVMVQVTAKSKETLEKHVQIFGAISKYRAKKDHLKLLQEQLALYGESTQNLEDLEAPYSRLVDTIEKYLKEEDKIDLAAL